MPRGRPKGSKNTKKQVVQSQQNLLENQKTEKVKLTNLEKKIERKVELISNKIGNSKLSLAITNQFQRYYICQRIEVQGKKDKFKPLFSCSQDELDFIQTIGKSLSEKLHLGFIADPILISRKKKVESGVNKEINYSIFKEYQGHLFIILDFGSIWLDKNSFHTKRNYEKIDGVKIYELLKANKFSNSYLKCKELLKTYSKQIQEKVLKEVIHFGDSEDKQSVRLTIEE